MLVPAGMFILLALGGICVDSAIAFGARRSLDSMTAGAANDAITLGIPTDGRPGGLQAGPSVEPDPALADAAARRAFARQQSTGLRVLDVQTEWKDNRFRVAATGEVDFVFSKAIPGVRHRAIVRSQSSAELRVR